MKITAEELAAKRARAAHLRAEIRSLQTEDVASRRDREMVVESEALDGEIAMLEVKVVDAARAGGGTVEDAKAAMERAAEIERLMRPVEDEEPKDTVGPSDDSVDSTDTDEEVSLEKDDDEESEEEVEPVVSTEPAFGPGIVRPDLNEKEEEGSR